MSFTSTRRAVLLVVAVAGGAVFAYTLIAQWDAVLDAIGRVSVGTLLVLSALQLLSFGLRTFCWEMCVHAAGASTPKAALHLASAASFFTSVLGPAHLAPAARVAALRRSSSPVGFPTRRQMVAADGVLIFSYGVICAIFLLIVASTAVPAWAWPALAGAVALVGAIAFSARRRLLRAAWVKPLLVMRNGPRLLLLLGLSVLTLSFQLGRWLVVLRAVGFPRLSAVQALLTYVLTSVSASPVPIGPGLYPIALPHSVKAAVHTLHHALTHVSAHPVLAAPTALAHSQPLANAVGGILILTISALLAAIIYALFTSVIYDRPAGMRLLRASLRLPATKATAIRARVRRR